MFAAIPPIPTTSLPTDPMTFPAPYSMPQSSPVLSKVALSSNSLVIEHCVSTVHCSMTHIAGEPVSNMKSRGWGGVLMSANRAQGKGAGEVAWVSGMYRGNCGRGWVIARAGGALPL